MFKPGNGRLSGKPTKSPLSNCPEVVPNVPSGPRYLRIWPPVGATIGLLRFTIVEIHLQYLPDAVLFPERGITSGLSCGGEPQAGSTCALARAWLLRVSPPLV